MIPPTKRPDPKRVILLLEHWLAHRASEAGFSWLGDRCQQIAQAVPDRVLFSAFSAVPRHLGKANLKLTEDERRVADTIRQGWRPDRWSCDQAGRTLLLLSTDTFDAGAFEQRLIRLFDAADHGELVALYQSLPLLPCPERYRARAAEGVRSNMTSVFEAVALYNPYPAEQLGEDAWNQMVLKAVFLGNGLHAIQGLERRANQRLARMLVDYARERWAARRSVAPELWRLVAPFSDETIIGDLGRALGDPDRAQQKAAALALMQSPAPRAAEFLARRPDLEVMIKDGRLNWESFGDDYLSADA